MAKGNMLLGMSRGSVGDVTFYRSGGSQRARARNRKPANPMTVRQQTQRAKFANAVKFHKQVTSNFFRFAYEDKKVNESDYNAFMRHNVGNSGFIGAKASKIASWPALGLWEVTSGSLPEITRVAPGTTATSEPFNFDIGVNADSDEWDAAQTIGALSSLFINKSNGRWREGDIVTVLAYDATPAAELPTVDTEKAVSGGAGFLQFTLAVGDTTPRSDLQFMANGLGFRLDFGEDGMVVAAQNDALTRYTNDIVQCACIHSRNSAGGLLVSTQTMESNNNDAKIISAMTDSGTYFNAVIADWDAAAEAVLQGSASVN